MEALQPGQKELTPQQEELIGVMVKEYIGILDNLKEPDEGVYRKWLKVVYGLFDKLLPERLEIAASPYAALELASKLIGEKIRDTDWCGISNIGWVSYLDYFEKVGMVEDNEWEPVKELRDFMRCAWDTVLLDECAIVIRHPVALRLDNTGNIHSATRPALEWADGEVEWAWHGVWVPKWVITDPRSVTREKFLAVTDTEQRRCIGEAAGWDFIVGLLGATQVDSWQDPATKLNYELLAAGDAKWLRKQSPALQDSSQPTYVEPVHEELQTAQAARKWQCCTWLSPAECEQDPMLVFGQEA